MEIRSNPDLANAIFTLRIESGFDKQLAFSAHLGMSLRQYQRLETEGRFSRKMLVKVRAKYPGFAPFISM